MPILYPSQSPISTTQLSQILPWQPSRLSQLILGMTPIAITIITLELLIVFRFNLLDEYAVIAIIILLATVVFTAFRYGSYPGIVSSVIASIYLAYSISPPGQFFQYSATLAQNLALIILLYFGLAFATGYLRGRINQSLLEGNLARALAEEQQNRLEAILSQLPIGVIITDANTDQIIYHNNLGRDLLEVNGAIADDDQPVAELIKTVNDSNLDKALHISQEVTYHHLNGQTNSWRMNVAPIYDMNRQHVSNVATFLDISHQKEVEQRKDDFISIASHELKTPVTSLKIYLQLMARQNIVKMNTDLNDIVVKANNQINKLARLMSDLLDVSQIRTGKADLRPRWLSLNNLTRDIVNTLKTTCSQKLIIKGKISPQVWADPEKITQVLTNLINNSIKYSDESQSITIHLSQTKDYAKVSIQDFGIGIDPALQKRIFEQFYQVRKTSTKTYSGLGIGLYISQQIIHSHQGEIGVESEPGKGSTFWFTLPLSQSS